MKDPLEVDKKYLTKTDIFVQKAKIIHMNKYDYSKAIYLNNKTKIIITCFVHGDFSTIPANHLHGAGCPNCSVLCGKSHTQFIQEVMKLHPEYDFSKTIYINNKTKVIYTCHKHGDITVRADSLLSGVKCRKCRTTALTNDEFLSRMSIIFNDKYSFVNAIYINNNTKVCVKCFKHGIFMARPLTLFKGHGCPKCYTEGKVNTTAAFVSRSSEVHAVAFDYSSSNYTTSMSKISIICNSCQKEFTQLPGNHLQGHGCPNCNTSKPQRDIGIFLSQFGDVVHNTRMIIPPFEIDCYLPDLRLGVEYHGLYWHSEGLDNRYGQRFNRFIHQEKALSAMASKISLMQIWDYEWNTTADLLKSMILHKLHKSIRIGARSLRLDIVNDTIANKFFSINHLQGHRSAAITIALRNDTNYYGMMSFNRHPNGTWEIIRMATLSGIAINGGASKMLKYFIKNYKPIKIITYADLRHSHGNVYKSLGFSSNGFTKPGYFYYKGTQILSRHRCQKHKLNDLLYDFDNSKSESSNMFDNGYRRCWDAGHLRFVMNVS